jgi:hypothetical protein
MVSFFRGMQCPTISGVGRLENVLSLTRTEKASNYKRRPGGPTQARKVVIAIVTQSNSTSNGP